MADPAVLTELPWPLPRQAALAAELLVSWSEPHRRYHDVRHLAECLVAARQLGAGPDELLALWFHDVVHTNTPGADETASAARALALLAGSLPGERVGEVVRLVLLTEHHQPATDDRAGAIVCDADLWILGAESMRYTASVRDLRAEVGLGDDDWQAVRRAQLRARLDRPIFHTAPGRLREPLARRNLTAELTKLG